MSRKGNSAPTSDFAVERDSYSFPYLSGTNGAALREEWSRDWSWRLQRQDHFRIGEKLEEEHRGLYADSIESLVGRLLRAPFKQLLNILASEYGFPWTDVAQLLGVSIPAIRKWRLDGSATPANHRNVAVLVAFVRALHDMGEVNRPATWLSLSPLRGYDLTLKDLYSPENAPILLDYACANISAETLFDLLAPGWRERYQSAYEVERFDDGHDGLVRRQQADE